ncbi:RidA family protein [Hydrogenophaga sp.]|uniref:RidA family protein n=1 Tax=Hydrogenophaga sp. TaxID=1904254 RepID=UPI003F6C39F7
MSVYDTLAQLRIDLPGARTPAAAYVAYVQTGQLVFLSGHTARREGQPWVGQLGGGLTTAQGQVAARAVAIDLLGTLQAAVGDLNRIRRIVKLTCLVNSSPGYTEHHLVANGASHLLTQVLGARGEHARSAFGVAQIPHGACVEIEMVAEVI